MGRSIGAGGWRDGDAALVALIGAQEGVVARSQLIEHGWSSDRIRYRAGREWRRLHRGVYITFTGPVPDRARIWAAVLYAGEGAVASHETALWLWGITDVLSAELHVSVPPDRRVTQVTNVRIHPVERCAQGAHPAATPPRSSVERAVLDVTDVTRDPRVVIDVIIRATQRRRTTAHRLRAALAVLPRHRWRSLLLSMLEEVADGVASPLEHAYRRDVERAHGLPNGDRNAPERAGVGVGRWYRDVRYRRWRLIIELDGREAHPAETAFRDRRRDNHSATQGDSVLRYGWRDVATDPCGVAHQVAAVLKARGWTGHLRACGPYCGSPR